MKTMKKVLALLVILAMMIPFMPVIASAEVTVVAWDKWDDDNDGIHEDGENTAPADAAAAYAWLGEHCLAKGEQGVSGAVYEIKNATDLAYFMACGRGSDSKSFKGEFIKFTADITWNEGTVVDGEFVPADGVTTIYKWEPYAASSSGTSADFQGSIQGENHTISGVYISEGAANVGFIGRFRNTANVKNLTFSNCYVSNTSNRVGMVVGVFYQTGCLIENVHLKNCAIFGKYNAGGFVGAPAYSNTKFTFRNCTLDEKTTVTSTTTTNAASFLGSGFYSGSNAKVEITDCVSYATVSATGNTAKAFYGGAVGTKTITNSVFLGTLVSDGVSDTTVYKDGNSDAVAITTPDNAVMTIEGVQTKVNGNAFDARFVASVDLDDVVAREAVTAVGFEIVKLADYVGNAEGAVRTVVCKAAYTAINSTNYDSITAENLGADYLATMVVQGIPANQVVNVLVRAYYTTAEGTFYGAYAAVTFVNGVPAGSTTLA